jgi:hypothetical protein
VNNEWKGCEGSDRGLILGAITTFAEKNEENYEIVGLGAEI